VGDRGSVPDEKKALDLRLSTSGKLARLSTTSELPQLKKKQRAEGQQKKES
jgi:hypothetical protein